MWLLIKLQYCDSENQWRFSVERRGKLESLLLINAWNCGKQQTKFYKTSGQRRAPTLILDYFINSFNWRLIRKGQWSVYGNRARYCLANEMIFGLTFVQIQYCYLKKVLISRLTQWFSKIISNLQLILRKLDCEQSPIFLMSSSSRGKTSRTLARNPGWGKTREARGLLFFLAWVSVHPRSRCQVFPRLDELKRIADFNP